MKKYVYVFSVITVMIAVSIFITGCRNENKDQTQVIETPADKFVASPEFQNYMSAVRSYGKELAMHLHSLSKEGREKVREINKMINATDDPTVKKTLRKERDDITMMDAEYFRDKILGTGKIAFKGKDFQARELLLAIKKFAINHPNNITTRGGGDDEWGGDWWDGPDWSDFGDGLEPDDYDNTGDCYFGCDMTNSNWVREVCFRQSSGDEANDCIDSGMDSWNDCLDACDGW